MVAVVAFGREEEPAKLAPVEATPFARVVLGAWRGNRDKLRGWSVTPFRSVSLTGLTRPPIRGSTRGLAWSPTSTIMPSLGSAPSMTNLGSPATCSI